MIKPGDGPGRDADLGDAPAYGRHVSPFRQFLNIFGCLLAIPCYYLTTVHSRYPVTLDILITIALTELNRFVVEGRRIEFYDEQRHREYSNIDEKCDWEKIDLEVQPVAPKLECLAAVVGWREDPALYERALESYKSARSCVFLLAGIDGDETEDQDMINVFNKVFPSNSKVIQVPEPLGEIAEKVKQKTIAMQKQYGQPVTEVEADKVAMQYCIDLAKSILRQHKVSLGTPGGIKQLCIKQRHMHKKGIMFTTFVFSLVVADILGVEFLWSSDSDTIVFPDSLEGTINTIAGDPTAGGASSGLIVHNADETAVTNLAATVYWGELYLTRSTPACTGTSDCQSGPSTAFRLAALPAVLVPWYLQTVFGKRMIVNEDRHLTTNLLLRGWRVIYASDTLTATDTPTTMSRWLKQQVRWARATHIESLLQPRVYAISNPLLFYGMAKREFGPAIGAIAIIYYFFTSKQLFAFSVLDLALRVIVGCFYNLLRNPDRLNRHSLRWVIPGIFFYYVPLPAVQVWSMLTLTADGWGTTMRASGERARRDSLRKAWFETGFFVVWMGIVAGSVVKYLAAFYCLPGLQTALAVFFSISIASVGAWHITVRGS